MKIIIIDNDRQASEFEILREPRHDEVLQIRTSQPYSCNFEAKIRKAIDMEIERMF